MQDYLRSFLDSFNSVRKVYDTQEQEREIQKQQQPQPGPYAAGQAPSMPAEQPPATIQAQPQYESADAYTKRSGSPANDAVESTDSPVDWALMGTGAGAAAKSGTKAATSAAMRSVEKYFTKLVAKQVPKEFTPEMTETISQILLKHGPGEVAGRDALLAAAKHEPNEAANILRHLLKMDYASPEAEAWTSHSAEVAKKASQEAQHVWEMIHNPAAAAAREAPTNAGNMIAQTHDGLTRLLQSLNGAE